MNDATNAAPLTTTEIARAIRSALKAELGLCVKRVSVRGRRGGYDREIRVVVKDLGADMAAVEAIASRFRRAQSFRPGACGREDDTMTDTFLHTAVCYCHTCGEPWFDASEGDHCDKEGHRVAWADTDDGADEVSIQLVRIAEERAKFLEDRKAFEAFLAQADQHMAAGNYAEAKRIMMALRRAVHRVPGQVPTAPGQVRQAIRGELSGPVSEVT